MYHTNTCVRWRQSLLPFDRWENWDMVLGSAAGNQRLHLTGSAHKTERTWMGSIFGPSSALNFQECLGSVCCDFRLWLSALRPLLVNLSLSLTSSCPLGSVPAPASLALSLSPAGRRSALLVWCWILAAELSSRVSSNCLHGPPSSRILSLT